MSMDGHHRRQGWSLLRMIAVAVEAWSSRRLTAFGLGVRSEKWRQARDRTGARDHALGVLVTIAVRARPDQLEVVVDEPEAVLPRDLVLQHLEGVVLELDLLAAALA